MTLTAAWSILPFAKEAAISSTQQWLQPLFLKEDVHRIGSLSKERYMITAHIADYSQN